MWKTKTLTFLSRWLRLVPRFPASSPTAQLTRGSCHYACSSSSPTLPASPAAWWTTPRTRTWRGRARMRWCVSSKRTGAAPSQRRRSFELMASWTWIVCSTAWKVWNSSENSYCQHHHHLEGHPAGRALLPITSLCSHACIRCAPHSALPLISFHKCKFSKNLSLGRYPQIYTVCHVWTFDFQLFSDIRYANFQHKSQ